MPNERVVSTRRAFLRTIGVAGLSGMAGCTSSSSRGATTSRTSRTQQGQSVAVAILAAGSLQHGLETGLKPTLDVPIQVEPHGSATVARMVAEGQRDPDIVTVADTALFDEPLSVPWYSVFTSNAVVVAYNPDTEGGQRLAEAGEEEWYEPMVAGDVRIGRTDPNQDPLGYRTLFSLELASRYYDTASNLKESILRRNQIYPETGLISQFETGSIDAAFAYRNMAVERGYDYIELPDEINLSNPAYTDEWYSTVSYTLPSGQQTRGDIISYGSTIRKMSKAALSVFDALTTGEYLEESGFLLREQFPAYEGDVPTAVSHTSGEPHDDEAIKRPNVPTLESTVSDITILH